MNKILQVTVDLIKNTNIDVNFTLIEIGAVQLSTEKEPFYQLLDHFPSSKIIGFEIDKETCSEMNLSAGNGVKYYPHALGEFNENRQLHITNHPMCCSFYKPNENLLSLYQNYEVVYLKSITTVDTITLDNFVADNNIGTVDFIKIDVQGAELNIFKGGKKALKDVLKIVCEVEFVPLYENQPLFGDVCNFLSDYDLMFSKFLGLAGRSLRPLIYNNDVNFSAHHHWSDAVFIRHVQKISQLNDEKLLKLSLLAAVYEISDLTFYCLSKFDERNSSLLATEWLQKVS
jgi:FkbM family methyltransferase